MVSSRKKQFLLYFFGGTVFMCIFVWSAIFVQNTRSESEFLELTFLDVGQGDSIFIETPGGRQILIDGGPDDTVLSRLGGELSFFDRDIDMVILTHPDRDHIAGVVEVLKRYKVHMVIDNGIPKDDNTYHAYREIIQEKHIAHYSVRRGSTISLGGSMRMKIAHPSSDRIHKETNENSLVIRLDHGEDSILLTGDIEKGAEFEIMRNPDLDIDIDILKVAHHGSKTSNTRLFLEKVTPGIAVISVGRDNQYGHPHPTVLENLDTYGIKTVRTDIERNIRIVSTGAGFLIK